MIFLKGVPARIFLFFLLLITGCNSKNQSDPVNLRFNLEKGKAYVYEMDVNMSNEAQGQTMNSNMEFDYIIEVLDDKNGIKTLKSTYKRIKMQMNMPNGKMDFDSDRAEDTVVDVSKPNSMLSTLFHGIKGKSFIMKVNQEGQILEINGLEEMKRAMLDSLKVDESKKPYFESGFKSQFNEENLKQLFSYAFNIFPGKKVNVGDSWDKEMTLGNGMMKIITTYTVKSIEGGKAVLDVNSTFDLMGSSGQQTGTFELDIKSGLITNAEYTQTFESPMKITSTGKITGRERAAGGN